MIKTEEEASKFRVELANRNKARQMREDQNKREEAERAEKMKRPAVKTTAELNLAMVTRDTLAQMKVWRERELYMESEEDKQLVEAAETLPQRSHGYIVTQADFEEIAGIR